MLKKVGCRVLKQARNGREIYRLVGPLPIHVLIYLRVSFESVDAYNQGPSVLGTNVIFLPYLIPSRFFEPRGRPSALGTNLELNQTKSADGQTDRQTDRRTN
jgi:hypothetical protein